MKSYLNPCVSEKVWMVPVAAPGEKSQLEKSSSGCIKVSKLV